MTVDDETPSLKACGSCHGLGVVPRPGTQHELMKCEPCDGQGVIR